MKRPVSSFRYEGMPPAKYFHDSFIAAILASIPLPFSQLRNITIYCPAIAVYPFTPT